MRKTLLITLLLMVGGCDMNYLYNNKWYKTREEVKLQRQADLTQGFSMHPEWSAYHKDLIRRGIFETGMTVEQVEWARNKRLHFEWESSSGTSYYSVKYLGRRRSDNAFAFFDYRFCFYNDKLESWSRNLAR